MATQFASLYDEVLPALPMAPPLGMVQNAIRNSVIEFCERTLLYRQELQQILVLAPVSTTTTAAAVSGATTVTVDSITNFADGDTIKILLDDDITYWRGKVSGTPAGSTITLDGALPDGVDSGATVTKFVDLYTITFPSGTALAKGLNVWLNDSPLDPISPDDLDSEFNNSEYAYVGANWRTDLNLPTRYYFVDDSTIGLALAPDATGALRINAALKPTRTAATFPDWIYQRYSETIAHGAKGRLMLVAGKPYTNKQAGAYHMQQFYGGVSEAMIRAARGSSRAPLRTRTSYGMR